MLNQNVFSGEMLRMLNFKIEGTLTWRGEADNPLNIQHIQITQA